MLNDWVSIQQNVTIFPIIKSSPLIIPTYRHLSGFDLRKFRRMARWVLPMRNVHNGNQNPWLNFHDNDWLMTGSFEWLLILCINVYKCTYNIVLHRKICRICCILISFLRMGVSKNREFHPKMDGENNGKPYEQMDWGGKTHYFRKHPYSPSFFPQLHKICRICCILISFLHFFPQLHPPTSSPNIFSKTPGARR